jgi:maltooligosyltrehalose trehalohydrolase
MSFNAVGARLKINTCLFSVWSPFRKKVEVILKDRNVSFPMSRDEFGYWTVEVPDVRPGARYFFKLDGDKEFPDPASRAQPQGIHHASMVVESEYPWSDHSWRGILLGEMIIYELHVGTFTSSHDFDGVISKLSYLKRLGVNTLELLPIAQFPGARNWGYDGVFPFAVQHSYGGANGLKKLVDAAHSEGMAVILDVVYNHQGPEGNYLDEYGPYFTDKYKTGWGRAINFDDAWCDGVRNFYWQNALMWLDEFHVDGLRLDAVHAIWDFSARHFIEGLTENVRHLEKTSGRKKVLIAEFDLNNPRYILPPEIGGYGLDGQWMDEFHHALHALVTGEVDGYYEDFGQTEHMVRALEDSYIYTGQYSVHRKRLFGRKPKGSTYDQFVVFAQNHDQIGNRMLGDRISTLLTNEGLKLAAAVYLLSPHVPMLFMGEEYGERNPFLYFISHTDEELVELIRKGRKKEFSYFRWQGELPDPQSQETFEKCILSWEVDSSQNAQQLFAFYQHLIQLRKKRPALQGKARDSLKILSCDERVISYERKYNDDYLLIAMNFGKETNPLKVSTKRGLRKIFDSASAQWGGPVAGIDKLFTAANDIQLNPQSVSIFEL